jgi:phage baseplate assembly protein W
MATLGLVKSDVMETLTRWEPRIELKDVTVSPEKAKEGKLLININYRVRTTNNEFNLVYPFYLQGG